MLLPTLAFITTLLCLQASTIAQSAPQISPTDEEAIIDALAAMQESPYPQETSPQFSNDELMAVLSKLQSQFDNKQFAYTPKDPRFYLAREDFPDSGKQPQQQQQRQQDEGRYFKSDLDIENLLGPGEVGSSGLFPPSNDDLPVNSQQEYHYMKKDPQSSSIPQRGERMIDAGGEFGSILKEQQQQPLSSTTEKEDKRQSVYETHHNSQTPSHVGASYQNANAPSSFVTQMGQDSGGFFSNFYYVAIIAGCSAAAVVGIVAAGICWYRIHERVKAAADVDYPAYGVTGPSKDVSPNGGDRKLAQSAHMYHYQHQKQQMAALQKTAIQEDRQGSGDGSDVESEDDNEDGDYTVYECPGLAGLCNTGEMEVKNPLYDDEPTPATPHVASTAEESSSAEAAPK